MTSLLLDSFWRAAAYCLHPRVIVLSLLPLLLAGGAAALLGGLYWDSAVAAVRAATERWWLLSTLLDALESFGGAGLRSALAPLIVVALAVPAIVVVSLVLVAVLMTPAIVNLVASRRFPSLERKHGASLPAAVAWSLGCTLLALLLLVLSMPLWLIPPLVLVLPPLIWGWLAYRVMSFDALAEHASADERREILREHRLPLWGMGIVAGYLGAAPTLLWAVGAVAFALAPLFIAASVWLYTLLFAFAAAWFAHYALAALAALRLSRATAVPLAVTEPAR